MKGKRWISLDELVEDILDWRVYTNPETGCWLWRAGQWNSGNGYGKVKFQGKALLVHRAVWTVKVGPIPSGMVLDHKICLQRSCCNPEHLELVTVGENTYRGCATLFVRTK